MTKNLYKRGEYVVLQHHSSGQIIVARMNEDFEDSLGKIALFSVTRVTGLEVVEAVLNSNIWKFQTSESISNEEEHDNLFRVMSLLEQTLDTLKRRGNH